MAKLSEIYRVGMSPDDISKVSNTKSNGGGTTAPASSTSGRKLSEYYTVGMTPPKAKVQTKVQPVKTVTQPTTQPTSQVPTLSPYGESIIKTYENLPDTSLISRLFSKQARNTYKTKQELNPLYEQAKDIQTKQKLNNLGITDGDVLMAQMGNSPLFDTRKLLKEKGMTDKAEIKDLTNAILKMSARENMTEASKNLEQFADEHPVLGTAFSLPLKVGSDIAGVTQNTLDYLKGNALTNSTGGNAGSKMVQNMRNAASDDLGKVGKFAYDVGTSIVDMAPIIALGGTPGLGYAGMSAAQQSIPELIDRGLTPNQIMASSIANGVAEAALEKLPLGNLEKWASEPIEKTFKSVAKVIGSQMASEGIEEMGTDVINLITDRIINGDKSQFKEDEKKYGFKTALDNFIKQTVYDGLAGAVSGGLMGGGNAGLNFVSNTVNNRNTNIPTLEQQTTQSKLYDPAEKALSAPDVLTTHTPEEVATMKEYLNSTDGDLLNYINDAQTKPYVKPFRLKDISSKMLRDIKRATGMDHAKKLTLDQSIIKDHIYPRHGINGKADQTMADANTLARIQYVLDNYDNVYKGEGSSYLRMADGKIGPTAVFTKKVDDHYVVAEVVSDKTDTAKVVSVHVETDNGIADAIKKGKLTQLSNDVSDTLPRTPEANSLSASFDSTISDSDTNVKGTNKIMAEDIGLKKKTNEAFEAENNIPTLDENGTINARGYAEPTGDTLTQEYRERGYAQHVRGEDTPMRVEGLSDEVLADFTENQRMYSVLKNADTKALADEIYNSGDSNIKIGDKVYGGTVEEKFRSLLAEKNPASLPLGHQLVKDYQKAGNHQMACNIIDDMGKALTESGQFSQAAAINMMKNDPLTALQYAKKQLDAINREGEKRFGDKWQKMSLTDEEIEAFNNIEDGDEEAIKDLYNRIGERLGKEYPTTFMEKLLEGRKIAMLFNVRTNVRNFGANIPTLGLRWMSDRVDALGQNIAHLINPNFEVTQSITGSGIDGRKLAKQVYESDIVQALLEGDVGKYEIPELKNALMKDRQMYKGTAVSKWINKMTNGGIEKANEKLFGKKGVESLAETIRNATYKALDLGDKPFVKENFIERLGSYIKAQGINSVEDVPDEAIQMAWEEAMKATYKDESWAVKMLRGLKGAMEKVPVIGKPLSQTTIPFLQAPGNIAARMVDYSPINATKGIGQILIGATKGNESMVRNGIASAAKGLTGTGLILLGMALKAEGLITGDYSDDKDEKNFQKANGYRPWALHVGNDYLTYDWAQPFAQNLMVGTLIQEAIENSDKADESVLKALGYEGPKAAINSWFGSSPLQGLADLMKGSGYSGEVDFAQNFINSLTDDFAGAFVPSLVNATAKSMDTTQRNYYDPSSKVNTFVNQQMSKIPVLSESLPAKYDTWGRKITTANNSAEAFGQRFLVPGDYASEKSDRVNDEINKLYKKTSDAAVFPQTAPNKVGDKTLNNKEVSKYQEDMGKRSRKLVESMIRSDFYKSLDYDSKVEVLKQIYGASKLITERNLFGKAISDNSSYKKLIEAFDNEKTEGVINYFEEKAEKKKAKEEKERAKQIPSLK